MDSIASVAFDLTAATADGAAASAGPAAPPAAPTSFDISHFQAAYDAAAVRAPPGPAEVPKVASGEADSLRSVMVMLQGLNGRAASLGEVAAQFEGAQRLEPGDILQMTLLAQEFLFHCELTSNVASRTSDGVQQLFREQS